MARSRAGKMTLRLAAVSFFERTGIRDRNEKRLP
jgi:hypothetical protein